MVEAANPALVQEFTLYQPYLMIFLQKYILFADFCFQPTGMAEIPAVLQECR
ncbi:hypothetical protein [Paenibacillus dendritiformis]|uniref:hypothetical protein n=1 Tax=Paenibacillus dendritiformis TaxID=130049 RepID=UPI001300C337|nr:hypothetical protein [Paenibacillus dendritiformis]CAH8769870.1 hypothetical protein H7S4_002606 [Paenibacillus dendritiformis]